MRDDSDLVADRHAWLLGRLGEHRRVTTNQAAADLGVSVDTVRRDLRLLHDQGLLRRVHGGAVPVSALASSYAGRSTEVSPERARLAAAVVERLRPGQVVGIDAGTTSTEIATRIPPSLDVTIITNNPAAAIALADHQHASVTLLGGELDLTWMAATGPTTVAAIGRHHLDLAVVGVCSIDLDGGASTRSRHEVHTKQAWIAAAAETLVPVESAKLGSVAPYHVADAADLEVLLVESEADAETLGAYRDAGIALDLV